MRDDFAIFILSHGRPNKMKTVKTILEAGYTGKYYIICDNEDLTLNEYKRLFGEDKVIVFDKAYAHSITDTMDNIDKRNTIVFARNMCYEIATKLGLKYFLELEDDYEGFRYRFQVESSLKSLTVRNLDSLINLMLEYLDESGALTIAFAQTGDFIGGCMSQIFTEKIKRKAMNTLFCRVDKPFKFRGRMNDDVTTYTYLGSQGNLFMTICDVALEQTTTQSSEGGLTEMYTEYGTYTKSFYSVICNPSCVKIAMMVSNHPRIHHLLDYNVAVPKIISDKFKIKE